MKTYIHFHMNVHNNIIQKVKKMKQIWINWWIAKQNIVYLYNKSQFRNNNQPSTEACHTVDEPLEKGLKKKENRPQRTYRA